jgi:hypothetical protein
MIEQELGANFKKFCAFIDAVLGLEYVAKLQGELGERGAPDGNDNAAKNKPYARKVCFDPSYGNNQSYLLKRIKAQDEDVLSEIGDNKKYKTVHEAAKALGIVKAKERFTIPAEPNDAGHHQPGSGILIQSRYTPRNA